MGMLLSVGSSSGWSWRLAPSCASPTGTPAPSQRTERFAPFWLYQWDSVRSSRHPRAPSSSRRRRPATPSRSPQPCRTPTVLGARSRQTPPPAPTPEKRRCAKERRTDPDRIQRVPLHACAQHQKDGVHRVAVRHPRAMAAERVGRRRGQERLDLLPQPVRHPPTVIAADQTHRRPPDRVAPWPADQKLRRGLHHSYWARPLVRVHFSHYNGEYHSWIAERLRNRNRVSGPGIFKEVRIQSGIINNSP